ncbi:MAG TPA: hypothetical protein VFH73_06660, partial [Polyangia bacterium]|nr:hypothetical protein [Polyangia bacterium]
MAVNVRFNDNRARNRVEPQLTEGSPCNLPSQCAAIKWRPMRARPSGRLVPIMVVVVAAMTAMTSSAFGRVVRPIFEPTDLELEEAGTLDLDLQIGIVRGRQASRLVIPDLEVDLGLGSNVELDIDGAYAIEGPQGGSVSFDHPAPDSLWVSAKLGVELLGLGWGIQLGPKLPVAAGSHGVGAEALLLVAKHAGRWHTAFNGGAFIDPD